MAVLFKPHLDCVCCEHRPECDCVSDQFKRHTLKIREYERTERQDSRIAILGVIAFTVLVLACVI